jgi:hypothetical protein
MHVLKKGLLFGFHSVSPPQNNDAKLYEPSARFSGKASHTHGHAYELGIEKRNVTATLVASRVKLES